MIEKAILKICPNLYKFYIFIITVITIFLCTTITAYAVETGGGDMWTIGKELIIELYNKIAGISTVLAALMSAVAVLGAKLSNNQHKVDQAWDWLKRIWIAWAIINGIGAFIAYIQPIFSSVPKIDGF